MGFREDQEIQPFAIGDVYQPLAKVGLCELAKDGRNTFCKEPLAKGKRETCAQYFNRQVEQVISWCITDLPKMHSTELPFYQSREYTSLNAFTRTLQPG